MKKSAYSNQDEFYGNENDLFMDLQMNLEVPLADDFTDRVMEQVRQTEIQIQPQAGRTLSEISGMQRDSRVRRGLKWTSTAAAVIGIASMLFFIGQSGTAPETLSSPPQKPLILADQWEAFGLLDAKKLGIVQQPAIVINDNGYNVSLWDVVADPTRMVLVISITDKYGLTAKDAMSRFDSSQLEIRNEEGLSIGQLKSISSFGSEVYENSALNSLMLTYVFPDEQPGSTVVIQSNIHELTASSETNITGDWTFSYEADMTTAQDLAVTTDLKNHVYHSPEGMKLEMEQIVHTPAGVKLEFSTTVAPETAALLSSDFSNSLGIMFHFEDENGEELSRINSYKSGGIVDTSFGYTVKSTEQAGKLHWTYYFQSLPYDSRQVRFILDGYYAPDESNDTLTFNPQELEKPAVFSAQGDVLKVNKMEIKEIPDEPGISGWMSVSGEFTNKFSNDQWFAHDGQGKEYKVIFRGSFTDGETITFGETESHANEAFLIAKGMTELPDELTLSRIITDKRYTEVNWSFDLPQMDTKKP